MNHELARTNTKANYYLRMPLYNFVLAVALGLGLVMTNVAAGQQPAPSKPSEQGDPYKPVRQFLGNWEGDSQGKPGVGKMEREYVFVLRDRFVRVSNKAVYPAQEKNPKGETHEDLGFIGYDRALKKLIFRQFHVEGFVVQYSLESISEHGRSFVFTSTASRTFLRDGGPAKAIVF